MHGTWQSLAAVPSQLPEMGFPSHQADYLGKALLWVIDMVTMSVMLGQVTSCPYQGWLRGAGDPWGPGGETWRTKGHQQAAEGEG